MDRRDPMEVPVSQENSNWKSKGTGKSDLQVECLTQVCTAELLPSTCHPEPKPRC